VPTYAYERLSAQDSSFLVFEGPNTHMHVGGVAILDGGPVTKPGGGLDIERIRAYIGSRLHWIPRYRQRLMFTPVENYPVWVDDDHFNLGYHVRHTSLPHPGDDQQLKRLVGRIMSQQLDRGKPLWEAWIVEGLHGGRYAFVSKAHHCMVDGIASVDLISVLLSPTSNDRIEPSPPWIPRPVPTSLELLRDETMRRFQTPGELARGLRRIWEGPERVRAAVGERLAATWQLVGAGLRLVPETPLNRSIGPHRRFDWLVLDLAEVKEVKNRFGTTVNDVVLAVTAGALRRFFMRRHVDVRSMDYRVVLPVSMRNAGDHGAGNRVSAWITSLPIQEADPQRRLLAVRELTAQLKASKQELGADALTQVGEWAGSGLLTLGVRLTARLHPFHLIITNVAGPQLPLHMLGARMIEGYPQVPLFENQGLGIALFSYAGKLCWGFNADWDLVPDLHEIVEATAESFRELQTAARAPTSVKGAARAQRATRRHPRAPRAGGAGPA